MDYELLMKGWHSLRRQEELKSSHQLTLIELILKIRGSNYNWNVPIRYEDKELHPTNIMSWRGSYDELALDYDSESEPMTLIEFHKMLTGCIGETFVGFKGGSYKMGKLTPIWVSNNGESLKTGVVDITFDTEFPLLITKECPFLDD